jgi:hypothetical protein
MNTKKRGATGRLRFSGFSRSLAVWTGRPSAFLIASGAVVLWALSGPLFGFSDTWQLVINTSTTIITFLMVFLIQNTQNRDTEAIQIKLGRADPRHAGRAQRAAQPRAPRGRGARPLPAPLRCAREDRAEEVARGRARHRLADIKNLGKR